jgi:hypothetical protein
MSFFHPKHTIMTTTSSLKEKLTEAYVTRVIDSMDLDDCLAILHDYMTKSYEEYTLEEIKEEVNEYFPDILD